MTEKTKDIVQVLKDAVVEFRRQKIKEYTDKGMSLPKALVQVAVDQAEMERFFALRSPAGTVIVSVIEKQKETIQKELFQQ